jgi:hypothetical protein
MSYNCFILFISIAYRRIDGFFRMTGWNRQGIPFTGRIDSKRHSLFPVLSGFIRANRFSGSSLQQLLKEAHLRALVNFRPFFGSRRPARKAA